MRLLLLVLLLLAPAPGASVPKVRRQREQGDIWGPWGPWGPCSRTCGGGISFQERHCSSQRRDGGPGCVGPARSHRTCHTESCPEGARDFRAEQCAQFDGAEFQGRRYRWLPYYAAPNKCELNCIPSGENFYYKHREAVVDGTPCEPGRQDVCVDGSCRIVGCDLELDSTKREDKCLQCGGNGTSCYPVMGTFNANDLSRGYNQILTLPAGATSVLIEEVAASRNFLAVRSVRGEYYLNGHWAVQAARALPAAGTVLRYERGAEGDLAPERLHARGPTSEPLVIELLSQERNPGVRYEYYLPLSSPGPGFRWSHGSWSDCSAECGGGHQSRLVFCTLDNEPHPDHLCQRQPRPADHRPCSPQPCPRTARDLLPAPARSVVPCAGPGCVREPGICRPRAPQGPAQFFSRGLGGSWPHGAVVGSASRDAVGRPLPAVLVRQPQAGPRHARWETGPWAPCSAPCGGGFQSRPVYCALSEGAGVQEATEEAACAGLPGKPPTTRACSLQRCAAWSAEPWGECSVSCGSGLRTRTVTCRGNEGSPLHATACSPEDRPPHTEPCVRDDCPSPSDQAWHVGAWGLCSKSCGAGTRRRQVVCALGPPGRCGSLRPPKPAAEEPCNTQPCRPPQDAWLPADVPRGQDARGLHTRPRQSPASDAREQGWAPQESPSAWSHSRGAQEPRLQQALQRQPPLSGSGPRDCRHAPHGCCPDGHTASLGPQWQGCPGTLCQQSRYGCCADGVTAAEGPHQAGCAEARGSANSGSRSGARAVASAVPKAQQPQAQQNVPSECRGSQFGCCYDNVASAAGPLGEGCVGQPSYAYPVRCLLPSAHGSCADWAARWYFIASVGRCNRFWYGGCHGNANNFASEEECMSSCGRPQPGTRHPEPGASGQSTRGEDSGRSSSGSPQGASQHPTGTAGQRSPLPSGGVWRGDPAPGLREVPHPQASGERLGPSAPALGGGAGQPAPPSRGNYYRVSLAGAGRALVQAAPGQTVQLFCPDDTSADAGAGWQKDGRPLSSDRHRPQPDGSLVISPLWAGDAGTYSCGSTRPGRDAHTIQLRIAGGDTAVLSEAEPRQFPPAGDPAAGQGGDAGGPGVVSSAHSQPTTRLRLDRNQPGVVDASPGQWIRLTCRAEGSPPPAIEWQKDGQPLSSPRYQPQPDGALVIPRVAVEDGGFYACVAFNGQDRDQRWVQLRVLGELTITGLPPAVTVPEGDTARLLCVVAGEGVNVRWSSLKLDKLNKKHLVSKSERSCYYPCLGKLRSLSSVRLAEPLRGGRYPRCTEKEAEAQR
ncbi:papilin isoform X2 [Dasypus novemcinctus]|uniref:papilin isoform X2 n=1 Tax=Dasypus novemcinctus TaxID=9361 RepID=UPI00265F628C|nr:papilin isoform X2 [Dasypus novemcinctus]